MWDAAEFSFQRFHIAGHKVGIVPAADGNGFACVQCQGVPLHPRHVAQIDQIAEMVQAEALRLKILFQLGKGDGVLDPPLFGVDGGLSSGDLQIGDLIQRNEPTAHTQHRSFLLDMSLPPRMG